MVLWGIDEAYQVCKVQYKLLLLFMLVKCRPVVPEGPKVRSLCHIWFIPQDGA